MPLDRRPLRNALQRKRTGEVLQASSGDASPVFSNANPTPSTRSGEPRSAGVTKARQRYEKYSDAKGKGKEWVSSKTHQNVSNLEAASPVSKKGRGRGKRKGRGQSGMQLECVDLHLETLQACTEAEKSCSPTAATNSASEHVPLQFQCQTAGCERETWNGQAGQTCCRSCPGSVGEMHGPDCERKFRLKSNRPQAVCEQSDSEESSDVPLCCAPGCSRETWNGQPGQTCCRSCQGSGGAVHGPDCERKFALKAAAQSPPDLVRPERHIRLLDNILSSAVQLPLPGEKVKEEPARLSPEEVERVFKDNVPGVENFLYRFQDGNYSLQFMVKCYQNGVFKFSGTELEDHFTWLMRLIVHHAEEGKPGCRGYLQEVAEAFMDCQDIQARAIEHVGFQVNGMTLDFRGLVVQLIDEYKAMAMKFLVTTEINMRGGPDDWKNDPVHFENRIVADIGDALGLNAGDCRRALLDEHKERNRPLREPQQQDLIRKFRNFFDLDVMIRAFVHETNSFSEKSPKESIAQLFLSWVSEHMPEKHLVFDEETFSNVDISFEFGLAVFEVLFLGETTSQEEFRGRPICELLPPVKK